MRKRTFWLCLLALVWLVGCSAAPVTPVVTQPTASPHSTQTPAPTEKPTPTPMPTPTPTPVPTPTPDPLQAALSAMTLEEKVGQMFFVRCPDTAAAEMVEQYAPGGVLLFGRDFYGETPQSVQEKIQALQASAKTPLLVGADEEGGTVIRISGNPLLAEEPFWSPRSLHQAGGTALVRSVEEEKAALLSTLGVNVNFAPVCDLCNDPTAFMYARSLGLSPAETAAVITEMVGAYHQRGDVGCVLKHFPGYGNATDTHQGIAYDNRPLETFVTADFLPFSKGIQAGAGCVMVAHNIVPCVDAKQPASLSAPWHRVLREMLSFDGVIITDDLAMDAITEYTDGASAAVAAVLAGNDMLCCSDYAQQIPAVLQAVRAGQIEEARIDESVMRILQWKAELGLLQAAA